VNDCLEHLEQSGYVMLPAVFTPAEVAGLLRDCETMLAS
jgi:hypothetical protein